MRCIRQYVKHIVWPWFDHFLMFTLSDHDAQERERTDITKSLIYYDIFSRIPHTVHMCRHLRANLSEPFNYLFPQFFYATDFFSLGAPVVFAVVKYYHFTNLTSFWDSRELFLWTRLIQIRFSLNLLQVFFE